jgi:phenylacetate-coenzyme A ligase PaaK-like adenylate-forming protein
MLPTSPDPEHEARALQAISSALREVPFYARAAYKDAAPRAGAGLAESLTRIPLLLKKDVRATLPKAWVPAGRDVKAELASGAIELVETSGSTGERLRVLWDKGWWLRQEQRAMLTNPTVAAAMDGGERPYREAVLTTPACGLGTCHSGDLPYEERVDDPFLFLNMRPDPTFWTPEDMTRMLDELGRHATVGLETDPMYLSVLARHAVREGRTLDVSGFVTLTYAFATRAYERAIRKVFAGPVCRLYGASEVGVLFMEGDDGLLHHAPITTHVELLRARVPTPGATDVALVVVTTLDRSAMPLVRFVIGDIVEVATSGPRRFTTVPPLASVEGRIDDALVRPDGAIVTAGAIDRALAPMESLVLYQVNQRAPDAVEIDVVAEGEPAQAEREARSRLEGLTAGLALTARCVTAIAPEPSGKFRVSRRHFPLDLARAFEGCETSAR